MNMLNFYNAEILWPTALSEKDIPRNDVIRIITVSQEILANYVH